MMWLRSPRWWGLAALALPGWLLLAWAQPSAPVLPGPSHLWPVLVFPVLEELIFRGGVQDWLLQRLWGARRWGPLTIANGLAALLFALLHLFQHTPVWAAAVFVPGLLFGWCYERWGLGAAIALHVWYNAGYFTLYPPPA